MRKMMLVAVAILMLSLAFLSAASADIISTFDTGLENWTGSGCAVSWDQTDGNPLASLYAADNFTGWAQVIAPAKFHGGWLNTGSVAADIKFEGSQDSLKYAPAFAISNGATTYYYLFTRNPDSTWFTYSTLMNAAGWALSESDGYDWYKDGSYSHGTQSLAVVLQNVTDFRIRVDFSDFTIPPQDAGGLDNVSSPVPLPGTLLLLGSGLTGLVVWRKRRASLKA